MGTRNTRFSACQTAYFATYNQRPRPLHHHTEKAHATRKMYPISQTHAYTLTESQGGAGGRRVPPEKFGGGVQHAF